jgi:hypothetical protein
MWFTIAFFSYPIAFILLFMGITKYNNSGKTKIILAVIILIIPIILAFLEFKNLDQINQELIGTYYYNKDTLVLNKDETFALKSNNNLKIGKWNLEANDQLIVILNIDEKKTIEMSLNYIDGIPCLETNPYHFDNLLCRIYKKSKE